MAVSRGGEVASQVRTFHMKIQQQEELNGKFKYCQS